MSLLPPRSLLAAYQLVSKAWPSLHPSESDAALWSKISETELEKEWARWVARTNEGGVTARLFYKVVPGYSFAGGNNNFFRDSTLTPKDLVGKTDFDSVLPWSRQAASYRRHDEQVVKSLIPQLDILERQDQADGTTTLLHTSKTAVVDAKRKAIGLLGIYELLDEATWAKMVLQRPTVPA